MQDDDDRCKRQKLDPVPAEFEPSDQTLSDQPARPRAACLLSREKIQAKDRDYVHYFAISVGGEEGCDQFVYQVSMLLIFHMEN